MSALYIGLMSGTSMDGIDVALVDFLTDKPHVLATLSRPYPAELKQQLFDARKLSDEEVFRLDKLDHELGLLYAETIIELLQLEGVKAEEIIAIGSHGQTVRHRPHADRPFSLQLGNAETIAQQTGITTITDFRSADIEAGGEGAPLAPAFHAAMLSADDECRCVVNIGGIANLTLLPGTEQSEVSGYDTGPGNTLMDAWCLQYRNQPYDENGTWARSGKVIPELLQALLDDDYIRMLPPKSTGFEHFNLDWLQSYLQPAMTAADVQATLCEFTATSITDAVKVCVPTCLHVLLCGGGVHNAFLVERITAQLPDCMVATTSAYGIDPDWMEAMTFAWLAKRTMEGEAGNLPSVTGARRPVVLGVITNPED